MKKLEKGRKSSKGKSASPKAKGDTKKLRVKQRCATQDLANSTTRPSVPSRLSKHPQGVRLPTSFAKLIATSPALRGITFSSVTKGAYDLPRTTIRSSIFSEKIGKKSPYSDYVDLTLTSKPFQSSAAHNLFSPTLHRPLSTTAKLQKHDLCRKF